jgi:hypothetical protein
VVPVCPALATKNIMTGMTRPLKPAPSPFTAPERELLRREFCRHFGQDPAIADGIFLRTWRGGARLLHPSGAAALRQLVMDKRAMDPERFAHLRTELGVDGVGEG